MIRARAVDFFIPAVKPTDSRTNPWSSRRLQAESGAPDSRQGSSPVILGQLEADIRARIGHDLGARYPVGIELIVPPYEPHSTAQGSEVGATRGDEHGTAMVQSGQTEEARDLLAPVAEELAKRKTVFVYRSIICASYFS